MFLVKRDTSKQQKAETSDLITCLFRINWEFLLLDEATEPKYQPKHTTKDKKNYFFNTLVVLI